MTGKQERLKNHSSSLLTLQRKDKQTESRELLSNVHKWWALEQTPAITGDVQVTVSSERNARLASRFRRSPCWGISTGHLHSGTLLQLSSNKVLSPWSREDSPSYHLAIVPLTDAGATWTGSDKNCQPKDLRKWDWIQ